MKLLSVTGVFAFFLIAVPMRTNAQSTYIGQEKCALEKLPLYHVLTVVEQTIKNMRMDILSSQEGDATAKDALAAAHNDVNQALALLTSAVSAINNNVLYEYGDICDRFIAMATCVGDFDTTPEPYIIRELRRVVINFDQYLTIFIATRAAFLSSGAKNTLDNMSSLNQLLIKPVLNDDHFSWGFLDYLDDYLVSRPLEFVQEHPVFVSSVALVIIASIIYCYWGKSPDEVKDEAKNHEVKDGIKKEQTSQSKEHEQKKDFKEIRKELEPVFKEIEETLDDALTKKNVPFMLKKEFNVLLLKNKKLCDLSLNAQELLYKTLASKNFYLPGGNVSYEKAKKVFDGVREDLNSKK